MCERDVAERERWSAARQCQQESERCSTLQQQIQVKDALLAGLQDQLRKVSGKLKVR